MSPSHDPRLSLIEAWLRSLPPELALRLDTLQPASSDASFRRYFRLEAGRGTVIVMDAPPPHEDVGAFVHAGGLLREAGLNVPAVLARAPEQGLLLLSDLGHETYYQRIQGGLDDARLQVLYRQALTALVQMQQASTAGLPPYDAARMAAELELFPEWYVQRHHGVTLESASRYDGNPNFLRIYWSGTAFWLETDTELRRTSGNRLSVDEALRRFDACCLPSYRAWEPAEFITKLDALLGTQVFGRRFAEYRARLDFPDLDALYRALGIARGQGDKLTFDDSAPDAGARNAVMGPTSISQNP